jgi:hypothetical protein
MDAWGHEIPCGYGAKQLWSDSQVLDPDSGLWVPSLRAIVKMAVILTKVSRDSLWAMIKLAIYEGKAWFGSLIHYLLHAGITCSLSADIEVFDKWWNGGNLTIDLNGIIDEALGYALPDNMQELVRQYMPDFQTLELEIPGLRALFGISASRWDFFFSKASTLTPMDFLNLIWQSEDLVKLEEWVPDAAGYLLEPGVL